MLRLIFSLLLCWLPLSAIEHIKQYEIFTKQYQENDALFLISRRFQLSGVTFYLTTNTQTLQTKVRSLDPLKLMPLDENFSKTPFAKQLSAATATYIKGGATQGITANDKAIYLSMDLFPFLSPVCLVLCVQERYLQPHFQTNSHLHRTQTQKPYLSLCFQALCRYFEG